MSAGSDFAKKNARLEVGVSLDNTTPASLLVDVGDGVAVLELQVLLGLGSPCLVRGVGLATLGTSVVGTFTHQCQRQTEISVNTQADMYTHGARERAQGGSRRPTVKKIIKK